MCIFFIAGLSQPEQHPYGNPGYQYPQGMRVYVNSIMSADLDYPVAEGDAEVDMLLSPWVWTALQKNINGRWEGVDVDYQVHPTTYDTLTLSVSQSSDMPAPGSGPPIKPVFPTCMSKEDLLDSVPIPQGTSPERAGKNTLPPCSESLGVTLCGACNFRPESNPYPEGTKCYTCGEPCKQTHTAMDLEGDGVLLKARVGICKIKPAQSYPADPGNVGDAILTADSGIILQSNGGSPTNPLQITYVAPGSSVPRTIQVNAVARVDINDNDSKGGCGILLSPWAWNALQVQELDTTTVTVHIGNTTLAAPNKDLERYYALSRDSGPTQGGESRFFVCYRGSNGYRCPCVDLCIAEDCPYDHAGMPEPGGCVDSSTCKCITCITKFPNFEKDCTKELKNCDGRYFRVCG